MAESGGQPEDDMMNPTYQSITASAAGAARAAVVYYYVYRTARAGPI